MRLRLPSASSHRGACREAAPAAPAIFAETAQTTLRGSGGREDSESRYSKAIRPRRPTPKSHISQWTKCLGAAPEPRWCPRTQGSLKQAAAQLMVEMSGVTTAHYAHAALLSVVVATTPFRGVEIRPAPRYGQING
jgi:hypothetical protein